ncbi:MAG: hypothetical protein N3A72_03750 [bacterium]|nr:hypothetical protein [bacterium]
MKKILFSLFLCVLASTVFAGTAVTYVVATSEDDTYARTGVNAYSAISTILGRVGNNDYSGYFRWQVNIPIGATITYSLISMRAYANGVGGPPLAAFLIDSANCPSFASSNPAGMTVNVDSVDYTPGTWNAGTWYSILTVNKLIQIFMNKPGYASGNYIGIRIGPRVGLGGADKYRTAYTFDQSTSTISSAKLVVYYNQTPAVPIGLAPLHNSTTYNLQPQFIWGSITDPDGDTVLYNFELDTVDTFNSAGKISVTGSSATTYTPGFSLAPGNWYWRVQSLDSSTNPISTFVTATSAWCATQKVTILVNQPPTVVTLLAPPNASSTLNHTPTFIWSHATDPDGDPVSYKLQVDDDSGFGSPEFESGFSSATEATPVSDLATGLYYWRVISQDTSLAKNTTSVWTVTLLNRPPNVVSLLAPPNASSTSNHTPTFIWSDATDPDGGPVVYSIEVSTTISFANIVYTSGFGSATTATPSSELAKGLYYWRVISRDTSLAQNTSATWSVTLLNRPPNPVTLNQPIDSEKTNNHTPTFLWAYATDPDGDPLEYKLEVDNNPDFTSPEFETSFSGNNQATPGLPLATDLYSWRVICQDNSFAQATSAVRTFIAFDTIHQRIISSVDTYTFYLGTWDSSTDYTPVTLAANTLVGTDTVTILVYNAKHPFAADSAGKISPPDKHFISRWWSISGNGNIQNADITFTYTDSDFTDANIGGAYTEANLEFVKRTGGNWTWYPASSRNTTANWVKRAGITSFSDWTLSGPGGVPVELSRFEVEVIKP